MLLDFDPCVRRASLYRRRKGRCQGARRGVPATGLVGRACAESIVLADREWVASCSCGSTCPNDETDKALVNAAWTSYRLYAVQRGRREGR